MSSLSNNNQHIGADKYYYLWRKNTDNWSYSKVPFIMHDSRDHRLNGSFLSSNWYKAHIPEELEFAIIKVSIEDTHTHTRMESFKNIIDKYIHEMDKCQDVSKLNYVVMTHHMQRSYLDDIKSELKKNIMTENDSRCTLHKSIETPRGVFSLSYAQIKNDVPCMYCPRFSCHVV